MGVQGLWKLIDAAGRPVPVETLENKVLAVDVSIWLHQLVKGFQGAGGANPHLLGLFYRICKLLFFRIKPIFVFDGGVPLLKKRTIAARQSSRSKASESIERAREELVRNLVQQHALGQFLGKDFRLPRISSTKQDTLFHLPPLPSSTQNEADCYTSAAEAKEEESSDESDYLRYGDLHNIDVNSKEFKLLPADVRRDILSELKETRKQNSWSKLHLMPQKMGDFSEFQMERLLKRRSVQVGLEEAEKEMGPRGFTVTEIQEILEFQGVDVSRRIAADNTTRFLFSSKRDSDDEKRLTSIKEEDVDDPVASALMEEEGLSQEDILKLIKEQKSKKSGGKEKSEGNEGGTKNVNYCRDLTEDQIREDNGLCKPEPGKLSAGRKKEFDDKQVTQLLKTSAGKHLVPISEADKLIKTPSKRRPRKKVPQRVMPGGLDLSESDDSSESEVSSSRPLQMESDLSSDDSFIEVNKEIEKSKQVSDSGDDLVSVDPVKPTLQIVLNLDKPSCDDEDMFKDIFTEAQIKNVPKQPENISNLSLPQQLESSSSDDDGFTSIYNQPEVRKQDLGLISSQSDDEETELKNKQVDRELDLIHQKAELENTNKNVPSQPTIDIPSLNFMKKERDNILSELMKTKSELEAQIRISMDSSHTDPDPKKLKHEKPSVSKMTEREIETEETLKSKGYFEQDKPSNDSTKEESKSLTEKLLNIEQVKQYQSTLEIESVALIEEKRKDERIASTVTEQITLEAQELLRLFGIPWVVAPMEAEAQCAILDINGQTQGTITDDSDIWLFGANNVYKNFFDQKKYVKQFKSQDIEKVYKLGRDELIMIGLLVGSDYTCGVAGVGPVTALEIVANYPKDVGNVAPLDRLSRFAEHVAQKKLPKGLAKKLLTVELTDGFPSLEVIKAYINPVIDESREPFSWGTPDIEKLKNYATEKFGWDISKTSQTLNAVLDKLSQDRTQTTLHSFFGWAFDGVEGRMSKRVEKAVNLIEAGPSATVDQQLIDTQGSRERAARILAREKEPRGSRRKGEASVPGTSHRRSRPDGNYTIEQIKKGKVGSGRKRKLRREAAIMKPNELDFEGPFGVGEVSPRKKVVRTDEEKRREIEEARAKAARVLEKLKQEEHISQNNN